MYHIFTPCDFLTKKDPSSIQTNYTPSYSANQPNLIFKIPQALHTIDGRNPAITSWAWYFIQLFTGF